mgnify:CR=1 FL=1
MKKYYFDTSIWLDVIEERGEHCDVAMALIAMISENEDTILFSDTIMTELKNLGYSRDGIIEVFKERPTLKLQRVHTTRHQLHEARRITAASSVPYRDAMHAVLTRDNNAILVSRDRHFNLLRHITHAARPEELQ